MLETDSSALPVKTAAFSLLLLPLTDTECTKQLAQRAEKLYISRKSVSGEKKLRYALYGVNHPKLLIQARSQVCSSWIVWLQDLMKSLALPLKLLLFLSFKFFHQNKHANGPEIFMTMLAML